MDFLPFLSVDLPTDGVNVKLVSVMVGLKANDFSSASSLSSLILLSSVIAVVFSRHEGQGLRTCRIGGVEQCPCLPKLARFLILLTAWLCDPIHVAAGVHGDLELTHIVGDV